MRRFAQRRAGIGDGQSQARRLHRAQVRKVIAHVGALRERQSPRLAQLTQRVEFVFPALHDRGDAQFAGAALDNAGATPADDGYFDSGTLQKFYAQSVFAVEGLQFLARVAVGDAPVGQYAIHVECQQSDRPGAGPGQGAGHAMPASSRLSRFTTPATSPAPSRTTSALI